MKQIKIVKQLINHYRRQIAVIAGLFVLVVAIGITCAFNATKEIKVVVDQNTVQAANAVQTETVAAPLMGTLSEVLTEKGYPVEEGYTVSVALDKKVKDVDTITIKKNAEGQIIANGQTISFNSAEETVGDLLSANAIEVAEKDIVTPAKETPLTTEVKEVKVSRVEIKEEKGQKDLPFETEEKENAELEEGARNVTTPGVLGKADFVDKVTYQDGVETARENISTTTVLEPVKEVVEIGTKKAAAKVSAEAASSGGSAGNRTESASSDFDLICAIVAHEGGTSYEGALAVISCVMNRVDNGGWGGSSAIGVLTAPGQFSSYLDGYYTQYLGNTPASVQQAVTDCMEGGVRSHGYTSF
ncbi:MAG: G5 domain-containing protein, partial [Eubacterium sp.]